ncbi:hypothetical protein ACFQ7W_19280 [Streptomyces niveus]|uniref:hypothetical protein n=1 Tax=Streptomyces niveus TaxID=193462 RepID=UPI0036B3D037
MAAGEKAPPSEWIVGLDDGSKLMDEALARTIALPKPATGGAEGMDLTPILADAADKMLDTLGEYADQLQEATDRGITFTLDGAGEVDCSSSGCASTRNFTGKVSSIARKQRVTQGEVTAVLSATFPVRGNNVSGEWFGDAQPEALPGECPSRVRGACRDLCTEPRIVGFEAFR